MKPQNGKRLSSSSEGSKRAGLSFLRLLILISCLQADDFFLLLDQILKQMILYTLVCVGVL